MRALENAVTFENAVMNRVECGDLDGAIALLDGSPYGDAVIESLWERADDMHPPPRGDMDADDWSLIHETYI